MRKRTTEKGVMMAVGLVKKGYRWGELIRMMRLATADLSEDWFATG
jgi:hypothetical protein